MGKSLVTQGRLKELMTFHPHTGLFTWNESRGRVKAGDIVGTEIKDGHMAARVDNKRYYLQQLVFIWFGESVPANIIHIDGDNSNNKRCNLISSVEHNVKRERIAPTQENLRRYFKYNPNTGVFTVREVMYNSSRKVGDVVGTLDKNSGYIKMKIDGKNYVQHRMAFIYMEGYEPIEVDHINHIKDDNRWENLREVTPAENQMNRPIQSNNTSGVTGVSLIKNKNLWLAHITVEGVHMRLGSSKDKDKAIAMRKEAEIQYGFHENHGKERVA